MAEQLTLNDICLTHVAATITQLLGIEAPEQATDPLETVLQVAKRFFHGHKADRVLMIISRYQYRPFRRLMLTVHANRTVSFKIDTARLTGRYPEVLLTSGLSCVEFTHVYVA